ncbi:hypothetical protein M422DRAFT_70748 [Sphaerobolus stellatus SS14]|uniref:Unplaced genomic scaffold SPHSTscaffold_157, whole genome shotgun sequence n=1 Tax=Sphaerobolus stellatus (strain SS14) TaxID=990650 RepID=A0A0C9TPR5_SPHS4|nr:hypothetical protein M422DRAFT_70748 [Sphaerobolus stellatus SS14]
MSLPIPIKNGRTESAAVSVSPISPTTSLSTRMKAESLSSGLVRQARVLHPISTDELRILLLENISQDAVKSFRTQGFQVDHFAKAWSEEELVEKIGTYHAIGIRSKTKITERVIKAASKLLVIGCFCIGTNQVDLLTAAKAGIPVFNSPFSNSRSVAELVIGEIVVLSRQLFDRARELKDGLWNKVSKGCWEVRGKTLGIVGYGHIGSQLSVLAESMGMRVLFYDVLPLMPLGSAQQVETLDDLLARSDFVTLHVPELQETINMIGAPQLAKMRKGAYLLNNARGKVVDLPALIEAVKSGHLAGAAVDVYPSEPSSNGPFDNSLNSFATELRALPNVILTPHIGGSTEEAQRMIGDEVATALSRYLNAGTTIGSVNFPEVDLRVPQTETRDFIRICHVHKNQPGVLRNVNHLLGNFNVEKQYSDSKGDIAYVLADIIQDKQADRYKLRELQDQINATETNILTRVLA